MRNLITIFLICNSITKSENYNLPTDFPEITVHYNNDSDSSNIFISTYTVSNPVENNYIIILNHLGETIFFRKNEGIVFDFKVQPNNLLSFISIGNNSENIVYIMDHTYSMVDTISLDNYSLDYHDFQILDNGNYLTLAKSYRILDLSQEFEGGSPAALVEDYIILELDQNNNIVFEWNTSDHFNINDAPHLDITSQYIYYAHANSIEVDYDGNILLSSRHMDEITKINRQTGEIIWRLGGSNNQFTFLNDTMDFYHSIPVPFCYQHDARRLENGNITLFDNGNWKNPYFSRAVEYEIDEVNKTATRIWEYRDSSLVYSEWMGNAQRLENGNTISIWNTFDSTTSIIQANSNSEKTFELSLNNIFNPNYDKLGIWSYRAFRFAWEGSADRPYLWSDTTQNNIFSLNFSQFGVNNIVKYYIYQGFNEGTMIKIDSTENNYYTIPITDIEQNNIFQISSIDIDGIESPKSNAVSFVTSGLEIEKSVLPSNVILNQNYPNPFNPISKIQYNLPKKDFVSITIYDVIGRHIKTLVATEKDPGLHSIHWDATNNVGQSVSAGVYLYSIQAGDFRQTKKMILLK